VVENASSEVYFVRVLQRLKKLCSEGERIVRLANLCRRLETEDEKVLPFPEWVYGADSGDEADAADEGYDDHDECETDDSGNSEASQADSARLFSECMCFPDNITAFTADSDSCPDGRILILSALYFKPHGTLSQPYLMASLSYHFFSVRCCSLRKRY